ncbi:hypothetical protein PMAYCL1PPCAC_24962, partial [Pristionchus mayeri]
GALIYRINSTKKAGTNVPGEDVIQLEDVEEPGNDQGPPTPVDPPAAAATEPTGDPAAAEDPTVPDALTVPVADFAEQADRGSIEVDQPAAVIDPTAPAPPLAEDAQDDIIVLDNTAPSSPPAAPTTLAYSPTEREEIIMLDDQPTSSRRSLEIPSTLRHSHRRQKRVSESPTRGVQRKTISKRRFTKNRKVTFTNRADSDITVLQQQPAAAVAHATYPLTAMAALTFLAKVIVESRAANAFNARNSMSPHTKGIFKRQRRGRPEVITLSDDEETMDRRPHSSTAPVSSNSKEVEIIELDDEPEEPKDPSASEEVSITPGTGDQSDDFAMVLDQSADVPVVEFRDLGRKASGDANAEKIVDFSLPETTLGEGEKEKTTEVVDSPPLANGKPKRRGGRPSKAEMLKRHQDEETAALVALVDMARDFPIDENQPSTSKACGRVSMGNRWSAPPIRFSPTWKKKK